MRKTIPRYSITFNNGGGALEIDTPDTERN